MRNSPKRINSVCPAAGWWAGFEDHDGTRHFHRLAVFASVTYSVDPKENEGSTEVDEVVGMDALDLANFGNSLEANNFRGYYHDSDFLYLGTELSDAADQRFKKGGY